MLWMNKKFLPLNHNYHNVYVIIGAVALTGHYTDWSLPHHIIDINCNGTETYLLNCSHNTRTDSCSRRDEAAVICQGKLRDT